MDAIKLFLENMFYGINQTPAVLRAKEELLAMMEDKYNELKAQGKTENEAVGQVISEFGNLEELADSLGIREDLKAPAATATGTETFPTLAVSNQEAKRYLSEKRTFGRLISLGVSLTVLAPVVIILMDAILQAKDAEITDLAELPGLIIFFVLIAIAVTIFIISGIRDSKNNRYKNKTILLDANTRKEIEAMNERETSLFSIKIAVGVALILLGVIFVIIFSAYGSVYPLLGELAGAMMLIFVAIAVPLFITAGLRKSSLELLLNIGDYTPEKQASEKVIDRIAGPYWLIVVVAYLAWSFVSMEWHRTWIIWPIAGVLFGVIAAIVNAVRNTAD